MGCPISFCIIFCIIWKEPFWMRTKVSCGMWGNEKSPSSVETITLAIVSETQTFSIHHLFS